MARTLVLHIGLPKAGSTSLQEAMRAAEDTLEANDVRFVRLRPIKRINALASGAHDDLWPTILGDEVPETLVLSSEYLCTLSRPALERFLAGVAAPFDAVHVVLVLRNLEDWVLSRQNQRAQSLPAHAPDPDAPAKTEVGLDVGDLDQWMATWSQWVEEAPNSRTLSLLPLIGDEPLPRRFLTTIGHGRIELADSVATTWSNSGTDERALDLIATARDLGDVLREREGLGSIREDSEVFSRLKAVILLAKQWERSRTSVPSQRAWRSANKTANALRLRLNERLPAALLSQVMAIVGTDASSRQARKARVRSSTRRTDG